MHVSRPFIYTPRDSGPPAESRADSFRAPCHARFSAFSRRCVGNTKAVPAGNRRTAVKDGDAPTTLRAYKPDSTVSKVTAGPGKFNNTAFDVPCVRASSMRIVKDCAVLLRVHH